MPFADPDGVLAAATARWRELVPQATIVPVSAVRGKGCDELLQGLRGRLPRLCPRWVRAACRETTPARAPQVELHSLSTAELNGATGVVLGGVNSKGRVPVRLDPPHFRELLVRPANLKRNTFVSTVVDGGGGGTQTLD